MSHTVIGDMRVFSFACILSRFVKYFLFSERKMFLLNIVQKNDTVAHCKVCRRPVEYFKETVNICQKCHV